MNERVLAKNQTSATPSQAIQASSPPLHQSPSTSGLSESFGSNSNISKGLGGIQPKTIRRSLNWQNISVEAPSRSDGMSSPGGIQCRQEEPGAVMGERVSADSAQKTALESSNSTISTEKPAQKPLIARAPLNGRNIPVEAPPRSAASSTSPGGIQRLETSGVKEQQVSTESLQRGPEGAIQAKSSEGKPQEKEEQNKESVQTKLTVGAPGDKYEQEADSMAAKVMRMPDPAIQQPIQRQTGEGTKAVQMQPLVNSITPVVQRSSGEKEEVQMKPGAQRASDGSSQASASVEKRLAGSKGGGSPLPKDVRSFMEPRFGADLSPVRAHTDSNAVQMNKELGAQAFAHGSDIYYGTGKSPGIDELTAHEVTHIIQQGGAVPTKSVTQEGKKENKLQAKADAIQLTSVEPKIQGMGNTQSQPAAAKVPPQTPAASPAAMMASRRLGLAREKVKGIVKGRSDKISKKVQPRLEKLGKLESALRMLELTQKRKYEGDDTDRDNIQSKKHRIADEIDGEVQAIIVEADIAAHEVKPVIPQERFDIFVKDSDFAPVDMTANPRFNGNGYNYKWVSPQPFQRKHFIEFFHTKKDSAGLSLRFVKDEHASSALDNLFKQKKIARLKESPNSYVIIGEQDKNFYVEEVNDARATGVDPDLKKNVKDAGGIVGFMQVMSQQATQKTPKWQKFVTTWDTDSQSRSWLKDQFRDADPGKHEWLPSNMIKDVIQRASDPNTYIHGNKWIDFQHEVRTSTKFLIFKLTYAKGQITLPAGNKLNVLQGHAGAIYTPRTSKGPKPETEGQPAWHDDLRNFYTNTTSLNQLLQKIEKHFDNTIWNGAQLDRGTTYDNHCDAKGSPLPLNKLEAQQAGSISSVKAAFSRWKTKFSQ